MKNRDLVVMVLLTIVTFGIYALYWQVSTKIELNKRGATIPTAWLLIVPIVNIWWLWKYSEGVDKETNGTYSTVIAFILLVLLGLIGSMIIQHEFNKGGEPAVAAAVDAGLAGPVAPEAPAFTQTFVPQAPVQPATPAEITPSVEQPTAPTVAETTTPEETPPTTGPVSS